MAYPISLGKLTEDGYKRSKKTITDSVQNETDIKEKLNNYIELQEGEVDLIPLNTHLRYLKYDPKSNIELFRFGGLFQRAYPEYIILKGKGSKTFCVQKYTKLKNKNKKIPTRFFKKALNNEKAKKELDAFKQNAGKIFSQQEGLINEQEKFIRERDFKIKQLEKKLKKLTKLTK